ncbi:patatin-domain-containing protein, partial [Hortaea werneckii]
MLLRDHHEIRQQLIAIIAMPALAWARDILRAVWDCFTYVAFFWWKKLYEILNTKTQRQLLEETLERAQVYEEWEGAALHLDAATGNQLWRESPQSKDYDCNLIHVRVGRIEQALEEEDLDSILRVLRNGLVRNIGNITIPKLYNRAYAGTKVLIEDYVTRVAETVKWVAEYPAGPSTGLTGQQKLEVLHDARLAFGRSCLVLQGGSIFGLCHIGVVKALHARGLLPRIISGTATGALMAALVGVHSQEELPKFLSGEGIDLSAFTDASEDASEDAQYFSYGWFATLARRVQRFLNYGYVLDIKVLEECVRDNVGDLTFDEAYQRSKKILNITITASGSGVPSLLNYLTAPNVLVWSAAMASNASDARSSPVKLLCKASSGEIRPWIVSKEYSYRPKKRVMSSPSTEYDRDTPLSRVAEQFNVNHFIISQARPYIAPFLAPSLDHSNSWRTSKQP